MAAANLYEKFFGKLRHVAEQFLGSGGVPNSIGVAGVIWPAAAWADEMVPFSQAVTAGDAEGAVGFETTPVPMAPTSVSDAELLQKLKEVFADKGAVLDELGKLLTDRPKRDEEVRRFQGLLRQLDAEPDAVLNSENAANPEDSGPPQGIVNEDLDPRCASRSLRRR